MYSSCGRDEFVNCTISIGVYYGLLMLIDHNKCISVKINSITVITRNFHRNTTKKMRKFNNLCT